MKKSTPKIPSQIRPKIKQIQKLTSQLTKLNRQHEKLGDQLGELERTIADVNDSRVLLTAALMKELSGAVPNDVIDKVMEQL